MKTHSCCFDMLSLEVVAELRQLRDRSGVSLHKLFAGWDPSAGLTEAMVDNWLAGTISTALKHHVEMVRSSLVRRMGWISGPRPPLTAMWRALSR